LAGLKQGLRQRIVLRVFKGGVTREWFWPGFSGQEILVGHERSKNILAWEKSGAGKFFRDFLGMEFL